MPKAQIIYQGGKPAFAVIPWDDYVALGGDPRAMSDEEIFRAAEAAAEEIFPAEVVNRLIAGESPIKVYREHRGLTQADLAQAVGSDRLYISQLETGPRTGSVRILKKIAAVLAVDLDDLVRGGRVRTTPKRPKRSSRRRSATRSIRAATSSRPTR